MQVSASAPLRILLVDDNAPFRHAIRQMIEDEADMEIIGEADDGEAAIVLARTLRGRGLDLVLMDIDMPGLDGIRATRRIRAEHADLPVIMLTVSALDRDLFEAIEAGAGGFLTKSLSSSAMLRALREYRDEGALPMSGVMAARLLAHFQQQVGAPGSVNDSHLPPGHWLATLLTHREQEVLIQMASGARDREIAERLFVAERTVKHHVQNILRKLAARNRTEAVARFRRGPE